MKIDKPRFRYLAALIVCIPPLCAAIGFIGGLLGAFTLYALHVITHDQSVLFCLLFTVGGLLIGVVATAQKIQQAVRVFRACDQIEDKKV
jgi:hypothetical protein